MDVPASFPITSKGQVTISKALRQQLGLGRGSPVSFELVGDHIELRPCRPSPGHVLPTDGFGLLSRSRPPVPVDFDPAPANMPPQVMQDLHQCPRPN